MSDREELFQIIWDGAVDDRHPKVWALVHAILAAGFRKPHKVTTAEELDALGVGSVVRDGEGMVFERDYVNTNPGDTSWWLETGSSRDYQTSTITLPATVIYEGERE